MSVDFTVRPGRRPDFTRLKKALLRDGEPDALPLFELMIDYPLLCIASDKPDYVGKTIDFFHRYGFDYIPAWPKIEYPVNSRQTDDTARAAWGQRQFVDEASGAIMNRGDFDGYAWPAVDAQVAYPIRVFSGLLPKGMKLVVNLRCVFEHVLFIMGYNGLSYALYDDLALVGDVFERVGEGVYDTIQACLKAAEPGTIGAFTLCDDMGHAGGTILSAAGLRTYVFPWHRRYVELIHSRGIPVILHSCGNLEQVMDDIIVGSKFDAKHSFEDKILPVAEAKARYGSRIALLGGVDMHKLCTLGDNPFRRYCTGVIAACMPGGGYAFGTGNSIANYVDLARYRILVEECMNAVYGGNGP